MGIPEPASPLWAAVKAVYDPWPADDEVAATGLADAWRSGGDVLARGAQRATGAGDAAQAAWPDAAGEQMFGQVGAFTGGLENLRQHMAARAAHAEYYGTELASVKNAIVSTIARNENGYAQLAGPRYGAAGPGLQANFAAEVAESLRTMIAERAAALRAYPAESPAPALFAAQQTAEPPPVRRGLTPAETALARQVFGDSLDVSSLVVTDDGFLADVDTENAKALPGLITFPAGTLSGNTNSPRFREWLVHELTHEWQYQHGANLVDTGAAAFNGDYDYGGPAGLAQANREGRGLLSFNYEEQADIIADYYALPANSPDAVHYQPYIDFVRGTAPGEQKIFGFPYRIGGPI